MEERRGILLNDIFEQIIIATPGLKISVSYGLLLESMILNLKSLKDGFQVTSRYWVAYKVGLEIRALGGTGSYMAMQPAAASFASLKLSCPIQTNCRPTR